MAICSKCGKWITIFHTKYVCGMCKKPFCADCIKKIDFPSENVKFIYNHLSSWAMPEYSWDKGSYVLCPSCSTIFYDRCSKVSSDTKDAGNIEIVYDKYQGRKNEYAELIKVVESDWEENVDTCREEIKLWAAYFHADKLIKVKTERRYENGRREFKMMGQAVTNPEFKENNIRVKSADAEENKDTESSKHVYQKQRQQNKERIIIKEGDTVEAKVIKVSETGRVFCDVNGFDYAVIMPQEMVYNNYPLPVDLTTEALKVMFEKSIGQTIGAKVSRIQRIDKSRVVFLEHDVFGLNPDDEEYYNSLKVGEEYEVEIWSIGINIVMFRFPDTNLRGYIEAEALSSSEFEVGDKMKVCIKNKGKHLFQLIQLMLPTESESEENAYESIDRKTTEERFNSLYNDLEQEVMSIEDVEFVKDLINRYPRLPFNKFIDPSIHIYCKYNNYDIKKKWEKFISIKEKYLNSQKFHINYNDRYNEVVLFNSDDIVMVMKYDQEHKELRMNEFYYGRINNRVPQIVERNNRKPLYINGSKLHVLDIFQAIPHDYNAEKLWEHLKDLKTLHYVVNPAIKRAANQKRLIEGKDFDLLKDILKYEIYAEEQKVGNIVTINPEDSIQRTPSLHYDDGIAFQFQLNSASYAQLSNADEDGEMYVSVLDNNDKPVRTGFLSYNEENHVATLDFAKNRGIDTDLLLEGFRIKRKSAVDHLDLQATAIEEFIKNSNSNLFDKILTKKLEAPDTSSYVDINFYNPLFQSASSDNMQPEAVRKALGNKDVVLIQGPPGTGKTTVIVEIIRQLAKENKKVLVCSQAHAAVKNIVEKLQNIEDLSFISVGSEGEVESWGENFDLTDYRHFIEHNRKLLQSLQNGENAGELSLQIDGFGYKSKKVQNKYNHYHQSIVYYYKVYEGLYKNSPMILDRLTQDDVNLESRILEIYHYQSMDVILGTCIGIGMNKILKSDSIHFDTVIIDEAAKANLAETLVPMAKADRYVLVGDDKQLPPYLDRETIEGFIKFEKAEEKEEGDERVEIQSKDVETALSKSLFEELRTGDWLPEESEIMLNFQYRMHPDIGQFISNAFYGGKVKMGEDTHRQYIALPSPYDQSCIFVETDSDNPKDFNSIAEKRTLEGSYYNEKEIEIICDEIVPLIQKANLDYAISVGIISPYKAQCDRLRRRLKNTSYHDSVYTIDSIQGMEFDIVVFSFVRSFARSSNKNVGFLDDMRRLNVSLSRAKKKLILVGNKQTLNNTAAHKNSLDPNGPISVFKELTKQSVSYLEARNSRIFHSNYKIGDVIKCKVIKMENGKMFFCILEDTSMRFSMITRLNRHDITGITVRYVKDDNAYRPYFELCSFISEGVEHEVMPFEKAFMDKKKGDRIEVLVTSTEHQLGIKVEYKGNAGIIYDSDIRGTYKYTIDVNDVIPVKIAKIRKDKKDFSCYPLL